MSWDVSIENIPSTYERFADLPEDFQAPPLCSRKELESILVNLFPEILTNDQRSWMVLEGDDFSIEFDSGDDDPVESVLLNVRGEAPALEPIRKLCEATGWRALDLSEGDYIDFKNNPDKGFAGWRALRDRIFRSSRSSSEVIGQGSGTYLVFLGSDNRVNAIKRGIDRDSILLGPIFLFRKLNKAVGIGFGILYFILLKSFVLGSSDLLETLSELALILGANMLISKVSFGLKLFELKVRNRPYVICSADDEEEAVLAGDRKLRP